MKPRYLTFALLLLLVLVAAGCGGGSKAVPADAVAVVGDTEITKTEFNQLLDGAKRTYAARKTPFPKAGTTQYKTLQDQAMQYLVQQSELEQKAEELDVTVTDKDVDKRLADIKKQYFGGSEKQYQAQLKQQGLTEEQIRRDLRAQVLSEKLYAKITKDVKVTDKEIKSYYDVHKAEYSQAESRDVRHILVNKKDLADSLYAQLKNGGNFAALAKKYSKDPGSAANGGKLTVSKGQTVPEFDKESFRLAVNEISKPIKTQYGWHIIQALSKIKPAKQTPLADVKSSIKQQIESTKKTTAMNAWIADVKKEFKDDVRYQSGYAPTVTDTSTVTTGTTPATTDK
jgi:foldase protein PrsA